MATLQQILSEQQKFFAEAKARLEAARKKPPPVEAAVDIKEKMLTNLKTRVVNLDKAKDAAVQRFNGQIGTYKKDITRLEKDIEKYKKNLQQKKKTSRTKKRK